MQVLIIKGRVHNKSIKEEIQYIYPQIMWTQIISELEGSFNMIIVPIFQESLWPAEGPVV